MHWCKAANHIQLPGEQWSTTLPLEEPAVVHGSCPEFTLQTFDITEHIDASSSRVIFLYFKAVNKNTNNESYFSVAYLVGFSSGNKENTEIVPTLMFFLSGVNVTVKLSLKASKHIWLLNYAVGTLDTEVLLSLQTLLGWCHWSLSVTFYACNMLLTIHTVSTEPESPFM